MILYTSESGKHLFYKKQGFYALEKPCVKKGYVFKFSVEDRFVGFEDENYYFVNMGAEIKSFERKCLDRFYFIRMEYGADGKERFALKVSDKDYAISYINDCGDIESTLFEVEKVMSLIEERRWQITRIKE